VTDVTNLVLPTTDLRHVRGDSRVVLVEFADFRCPFCARYATTTAPILRRELVDTGQLAVAFINFPLAQHPMAVEASAAAECAGAQGLYWQMHDSLFRQTDAPPLDVPHLVSAASDIAAEAQPFESCLSSDQTATTIDRDIAEGHRLAVSSTPTFFVGLREPGGNLALFKRINGDVPIDMFRAAIADVVARADPRLP
jgi:protein-disulfide isomerase